MGFQAAVRTAAVTELRAFRDDRSSALQVNSGRPKDITCPSAFVDTIRETITYLGPTSRQRTPQVEVVFLHSLFDAPSAAENKDAFIDEFIDWMTARYHAAGANTLIAVVATEDDPVYIADWQMGGSQQPYFATRITLEGFAGD